MKKPTCTRWYKQVAKLGLCALALVCFLPSTALADNSSDKIVKSIEDLRDKMINWGDSAMQQHFNEIHAPDAYQPFAQTANPALAALSDALKKTMNEEVAPKLQNWLLGAGNATERRVKLLSVEASDSFYFKGKPPGGDKKSSMMKNNAVGGGASAFRPEGGAPTKPGEKNKERTGESNFDFGTLISVSGYEDKEDSDSAKRVIQFLMASVEPISNVDLSKLSTEQRKKFESSPNAMDYKIYMRTMAAQLSVTLNNLLDLYARRIKIPEAGTKAGMPDTKDASVEEIEEYIATHRTKDPKWYMAMTQASPAAINKEMLFVMAEMQKQLLQLHKDNERLIATLSVMQLQNIQMTKALNKPIEEKATNLVSSILEQKESTTP